MRKAHRCVQFCQSAASRLSHELGFARPAKNLLTLRLFVLDVYRRRDPGEVDARASLRQTLQHPMLQSCPTAFVALRHGVSCRGGRKDPHCGHTTERQKQQVTALECGLISIASWSNRAPWGASSDHRLWPWSGVKCATNVCKSRTTPQPQPLETAWVGGSRNPSRFGDATWRARLGKANGTAATGNPRPRAGLWQAQGAPSLAGKVF